MSYLFFFIFIGLMWQLEKQLHCLCNPKDQTHQHGLSTLRQRMVIFVVILDDGYAMDYSDGVEQH